MKNVLIIGASGNIASQVIEMLAGKQEIKLTLFVRKQSRLRVKNRSQVTVVEGDALDEAALQTAMKGQDIVYVNLAGDLERMAKNIVHAMKAEAVPKVIFISSIGIYDAPLKSVLEPYRKGADAFEASGLDYTILRPTWFTNINEVDYETTLKGTPEKGSVISQKSLAALITDVIEQPGKYVNANLGVNKPNS